MDTIRIQTYNDFEITLHLSEDGHCFCPVCGHKARNKSWRPYDMDGYPSYDICFCGFEYGYDDGGEPPFDVSWFRYRQKWLDGEVEESFRPTMSRSEKIAQLKNIGIDKKLTPTIAKIKRGDIGNAVLYAYASFSRWTSNRFESPTFLSRTVSGQFKRQ